MSKEGAERGRHRIQSRLQARAVSTEPKVFCLTIESNGDSTMVREHCMKDTEALKFVETCFKTLCMVEFCNYLWCDLKTMSFFQLCAHSKFIPLNHMLIMFKCSIHLPFFLVYWSIKRDIWYYPNAIYNFSLIILFAPYISWDYSINWT